jgi:hypothetical protein
VEAPSEVVTSKKLQELVQQIDSRDKLDEEVEEVFSSSSVILASSGTLAMGSLSSHLLDVDSNCGRLHRKRYLFFC